MTEGEKKSNKIRGYIFLAVILVGIIWMAVSCNKKLEPHYELSAQSYSMLYIKENYYSDADFPTQKYDIVSQGRRYDVKGKFSHAGVVYTFEIIGEFPKENTDEYRIEYVAIDNRVMLDAIGK